MSLPAVLTALQIENAHQVALKEQGSMRQKMRQLIQVPLKWLNSQAFAYCYGNRYDLQASTWIVPAAAAVKE